MFKRFAIRSIYTAIALCSLTFPQSAAAQWDAGTSDVFASEQAPGALLAPLASGFIDRAKSETPETGIYGLIRYELFPGSAYIEAEFTRDNRASTTPVVLELYALCSASPDDPVLIASTTLDDGLDGVAVTAPARSLDALDACDILLVVTDNTEAIYDSVLFPDTIDMAQRNATGDGLLPATVGNPPQDEVQLGGFLETTDPMGEGERAQSGCEICIEGTLTYNISGSNIRMTAERIINRRSGGRSGSLRFEVWAHSLPVSGTVTHYKLGSYQLNPLDAGFYYPNVDVTVDYTRPNRGGCFYVSWVVLEYDGSYRYTDWFTSSNCIVYDGDQTGSCCGGNTPTPSPTRSPTPSPTNPPPPSGAATMGNLSTRGYVGTGDNILFGGLIVRGSGSRTFVIAGLGPSLEDGGVSSSQSLDDPLLRITNASNGQQLYISDDAPSERRADAAGRIQRAGYGAPNFRSREAIQIVTLSAGGYGCIVEGFAGTTGIGQIGIWDVTGY